MFSKGGSVAIGITAAIGRILLLDLIVSIDSIITAAGTTDEVTIMVIAVLVAVTVMLVAADPLAMLRGESNRGDARARVPSHDWDDAQC